MDKRGFGIVGAIIAMVIAGLIVYGIIYYGPSAWQAIQGRGTLSIKDVLEHPDQYYGKAITVNGKTFQDANYDWDYFDNTTYIIQSVSGNAFALKARRTTELINWPVLAGAEYRFTGMLVNENGIPVLHVSNIEST